MPMYALPFGLDKGHTSNYGMWNVIGQCQFWTGWHEAGMLPIESWCDSDVVTQKSENIYFFNLKLNIPYWKNIKKQHLQHLTKINTN